MERHKELQYNNKRDECIFVQFNVKLPTITTMFLKAKKERERKGETKNECKVHFHYHRASSLKEERTYIPFTADSMAEKMRSIASYTY